MCASAIEEIRNANESQRRVTLWSRRKCTMFRPLAKQTHATPPSPSRRIASIHNARSKQTPIVPLQRALCFKNCSKTSQFIHFSSVIRINHGCKLKSGIPRFGSERRRSVERDNPRLVRPPSILPAAPKCQIRRGFPTQWFDDSFCGGSSRLTLLISCDSCFLSAIVVEVEEG